MFAWLADKIQPYLLDEDYPQIQDLITSNLNLQEEVFTLQDNVRAMAEYLGFTIEDGVAAPSKPTAQALFTAATAVIKAGEEHTRRERVKFVMDIMKSCRETTPEV